MQQGDGSAVLADLHGPEPEVPQGAIGGAVQARAFGLNHYLPGRSVRDPVGASEDQVDVAGQVRCFEKVDQGRTPVCWR